MIVRTVAVLCSLALVACQSVPSGQTASADGSAPAPPPNKCDGLRTSSTIGSFATIRVSAPPGSDVDVQECRAQADLSARQLAQTRLCDPQNRAARLGAGANPRLSGGTLIYLYECA